MDNVTSTFEADMATTVVTATKFSGFHQWHNGLLASAFVTLVAGVPGNLLTFLAYFKYEQLHSPTNLLICSQSFGDLFTCLTAPLFAVLNYTETGIQLASSNKYLCLVGLAFILLALQSSIMSILALSTERFIAVYFSLQYYQWVTDANVKRVVVTIWTVVICINFLPLLGWDMWRPGVVCQSVTVYPRVFFQAFFTFPSMICLLICALENLAIATIAIRRQRSIAPQVVVENVEQQTEEANVKSRNQFRVTKMMLLVVGCFYATWMPFIVFNSIFFSIPTSWKINGVPEWILISWEYSKILLVSNTFFNPFIYGWKNRTFRNAYYKVLGIRRSQDDD